jgi:hypothetical protein
MDEPIPLEMPPGLSRMGTEYQNKGAFYDANLWRWAKGKSGPVGGWSELGSLAAATVRGIHSWLDINSVGRVALASRDAIRVVDTSGSPTTITPSGMTSQPDTSQWSIDNAGQRLFLVNDSEGLVRTWLPGDMLATTLSNAPTAAALVVTQESILMLFGAGGDPRKIQWSDLDAYTTWTPDTINYTRDFPLQSAGKIMCGRKIRGGILVLTSEDAHIGRFLDFPLVYGFTEIGKSCGIISRNADIVIDDQAYWMGKDKFFMSSGGGVQELPCLIHDDVFGSAEEPTRGLNRTYAAKVYAGHVSQHNEIWWHYPKGSATENSTAVVYNYAERTWTYHAIVRLCAIESGNGFDYPLMVGSDGKLWRHEIGESRTGAGTIFARSGPMELGEGGRVIYGDMLIPDEGTAGDVQTYIHSRLYPNASETTLGPFTSANPTGCRFSGRQVSIEHRLVNANDGGRVGTFRVKVVPGGER